MLRAYYQRRVTADIRRWRDAGWVDERGATAILASVGEPRSALGFAGIVAILGAVLLGAGVVAFVAANWDGMPRVLRLVLCIALLAASYAAAATLSRRGMARLAEAALVLSGFVFAASIALVGQTYHLSGDFAGAVLLWVIGSLAAAFLTRSPAITVMTLAGAGYWTWLATIGSGQPAPHLLGAIPILLCGVAAVLQRSRLAAHAFSLVLLFWLAMTVGAHGDAAGWEDGEIFPVFTAIALMFFALGEMLSTGALGRRLVLIGESLTWPALAGLLLSLAFAQTAAYFAETAGDGRWLVAAPVLVAIAAVVTFVAGRAEKVRNGLDVAAVAVLGIAAVAFGALHGPDGFGTRLASAALVLSASLWVVAVGHTSRNQVGKKTGLAAFALEVLYIYTVTIGTLIDTAVALVVGGVLFIALAFLIVRIDRWLKRRRPAGPQGAPAGAGRPAS